MLKANTLSIDYDCYSENDSVLTSTVNVVVVVDAFVSLCFEDKYTTNYSITFYKVHTQLW